MSSHTTPHITERAMKIAEAQFPQLAAKSGRVAYMNTLNQTGGVVVKTSQGEMVERRSDGTVTVIKSLPAGKRVKSGVVLKRVK